MQCVVCSSSTSTVSPVRISWLWASVPTAERSAISHLVFTIFTYSLLPLKLAAGFIICQRGDLRTAGGIFCLCLGVCQSLDGLLLPAGTWLQEEGRKAVATAQHPLGEQPWPTSFQLHISTEMGRTMSTYVSQLEEPKGFHPVSSWLCTSHMLSPQLLTSAGRTEFICPGLVGASGDGECLLRVLSSLTVCWGCCFFVLTRKNQGEQAGGLRVLAGVLEEDNPRQVALLMAKRVFLWWEGDLPCMRRAE